jgi:Fe-Mn family superoxide dismutase
MKTIEKEIQIIDSGLKYPYSIPELPFSYDALEPWIDKLTMEIHHGKHHAAYVNNLNNAIKGSEHEHKSLTDLFSDISTLPASIRNNGGGHFNHSFFWTSLSSESSKKPSGELLLEIEKAFGSFDTFKTVFSDAAVKRFGSGWAWLAYDENKKLFVTSTANQDNPLMNVAEKKGIPLLGIDVWEHAYYLKYQNRRTDYINAFWEIVNWDIIEKRFIFA